MTGLASEKVPVFFRTAIPPKQVSPTKFHSHTTTANELTLLVKRKKKFNARITPRPVMPHGNLVMITKPKSFSNVAGLRSQTATEGYHSGTDSELHCEECEVLPRGVGLTISMVVGSTFFVTYLLLVLLIWQKCPQISKPPDSKIKEIEHAKRPTLSSRLIMMAQQAANTLGVPIRDHYEPKIFRKDRNDKANDIVDFWSKLAHGQNIPTAVQQPERQFTSNSYSSESMFYSVPDFTTYFDMPPPPPDLLSPTSSDEEYALVGSSSHIHTKVSRKEKSRRKHPFQLCSPKGMPSCNKRYNKRRNVRLVRHRSMTFSPNKWLKDGDTDSPLYSFAPIETAKSVIEAETVKNATLTSISTSAHESEFISEQEYSPQEFGDFIILLPVPKSSTVPHDMSASPPPTCSSLVPRRDIFGSQQAALVKEESGIFVELPSSNSVWTTNLKSWSPFKRFPSPFHKKNQKTTEKLPSQRQ